MNRSGVPLTRILLSGILLLLLSVCVAAGVLFATRTDAFAEPDEPVTPKIQLTGGNINVQVSMTDRTVPYTGENNNLPAVITVVYNSTTTLVAGTDYTVSSPDVNVGSAGVVVRGMGAYEGEVTQQNVYEIVSVALTEENVSCFIADGDKTVAYTGTANNLPAADKVTVTLNGKTTLPSSDYVLTSNSVDEGAADITVTASGVNCTGSVTLQGVYTIEKLAFTADNITYEIAEADKDVTYTGHAGNVPSNVVVKLNGTTLTADDYSLTSESVDKGAASLTVSGKGRYKGEVTFENAFNIVKEENNEWLENPNILGWMYNGFTVATSAISARPKAGFARIFIMKATDDFQGVGASVPIDGKTFFTFEEDYTLSEQVVNDLNNLPVGKYIYRVMVPETENYSGLPATDVRFEVAPLVNYWESSPNIIRWSYGEFKSNVNKITAKPRYILENHLVTFTVYDKDYINPVNADLTGFTTDNGTNVAGMVTDRNVVDALNALEAGTYYLEASYYGNANMPALKTPIQFTVFRLQNHWETTPNIVQWKWGEYDKEINTLSAVPAIGNREDVVYGIYKDSTCNDRVNEALASFTFTKNTIAIEDENGSFIRNEITYTLADEVTAALEKLDAGTYYLRATLEGTNNYTGLGEASSIEFKVQNVQNHWTATPSVLSWKYGEYDRTFNKIYAEPAQGEETLFSVYDKDGDAVLFADGSNIVSKFKLTEGLVPDYVAQKLKTLDVGRYYMLASVEGNVNYTGLNNYTSAEDIKEYAIEFEVTTSTNTWTDIPKILSWGEGRFDSEVNGIVATAANGNDKMRIRVYDAGGNVVLTNNNGGKLDYDELAKLGVGSYRVTFEIDGTNNYTKLTGETTFAVFEDSVGLSGIIAAAIVFGVFDVAAAAVCVVLIVRRRKKIEQNFREMVRRELGRR